MIERNLMIYRHTWPVILAEIFEPLLYLLARIGTVGIEPQRGAAGDRALDDRNALKVRLDVLTDLDLECAKSHRQPVFNLLPNSVGIEGVDRRQQP